MTEWKPWEPDFSQQTSQPTPSTTSDDQILSLISSTTDENEEHDDVSRTLQFG